MFCPLLPAIILPTSFILFYIKKVIASHITTTAAVNSCTLCLHTVQPADQPRTRQARDIPLCQDKLPLPSPYAAHPICRPRSHWLHHCQVNLNSPLSTLTCWYSHSVCSSAHTSGYIPAPPVDHSGRTRCSGEGPPVIIHPTVCPCREKQYMYTVINELVDDVENCEARQFLDYLGSSGFVVPAIVLLL